VSKNNNFGLGLITVLLIIGALLTAGGVVSLPAVRQEVWQRKVVLVLTPTPMVTPTSEVGLSPTPSSVAFAPGQVLVGLKSGYTKQDLEKVIASLGVEVLSWNETARFAKLEVPRGQEKIWVERFSKEPIIAWAELNETMQVQPTHEVSISCQIDRDCPPSLGCWPLSKQCPSWRCQNHLCVLITEKENFNSKSCTTDQDCVLMEKGVCSGSCPSCHILDLSSSLFDAFNKEWCRQNQPSQKACPHCDIQRTNMQDLKTKCVDNLCTKTK